MKIYEYTVTVDGKKHSARISDVQIQTAIFFPKDALKKDLFLCFGDKGIEYADRRRLFNDVKIKYRCFDDDVSK